MNRQRAVWMIAARDFRERVATKAFRFGTLITAIVVAAAVVVPALLADDTRPVRTVTVVGDAPVTLTQAVTQLGPSTGIDVRVINAADSGQGEQQLRDGQASLMVVPGQELVTKSPLNLTSSTPGDTERLAASVNELTRLYAGLAAAGLDQAETATALSSPALPLRSIEAPEPGDDEDTGGASSGVVIAVFVFLLIYTAWVTNSVIEEKTSRVVEVMLSTVRASDLITGKIVGTALVALLQGSVLVAVVIGAQLATDADTGPLSPEHFLAALMWLVLGYLLYAWMYAGAAALANRSQDAQSLTFPIQVPLMISYFVSIFGGIAGGTPALDVLSFIPFTAPMAMLTRMVMGDAEAWEVIVSLVLVAVTIAIVRRLAVIVYTGAILRTGQRTKLSDAWRSARS